MRLFHHVSCIPVVDGVLLEWRIKDECTPRSFQVFANCVDRQVVINSPILNTGRCYIKSNFAGLVNNYRIRVTLTTGESEDSDVIQPQNSGKQARLLLSELRKKDIIYTKSHPFSRYEFTLFLKNQYGTPCELCGSGLCSGLGGAPIDPKCPICLGTGINDPYYIYPKKEFMVAVTPKNDEVIGDPGVQRNIVTRAFKTSCPLYLREDDIIMTDNEAYIIAKQQVVSSVGNAPLIYTLTCSQLPTDEPRYEVLINMCKRAQ